MLLVDVSLGELRKRKWEVWRVETGGGGNSINGGGLGGSGDVEDGAEREVGYTGNGYAADLEVEMDRRRRLRMSKKVFWLLRNRVIR